MTKVDILRLDSVTNNDTTATSTINTNFQAIQDAMENTLSRDGSTPNFMDADLDMNSYKIINAGDPENDSDVITKGWFDQYVDDAAGASATAVAAADRAEGSAQAAQTAAAQAAIAAGQIGDNVRLSRDWAIKMDGTVDGVDYSSKYYASQIIPIASDITTVSGIASDISTVATDIANINAVAADLTNIDNASQYAAEAKQWAIGDPSEPVDGSAKYWAQQAAGQVIPSQTGHSGEYLTTDGTALSWDTVDALPDQTGQSGKYLTTDGTDASWATLSVNPDNKSITTNTSDELQTVGVINQNATTTAIKTWTGTKAQYNAIASKDSNTLYNITDDTDTTLTLLETLYPVGSVYITTANTCPLSTLISGSTWVEETSRILVDKYVSGTDWWELYSDGWCVQGGHISKNTTVVLAKEYKDTNYSVSFASSNVGGGGREGIPRVYDTKTTTGFVYSSASTVNCGADYVAFGYTSTTTTYKRFRRTL